MLSKIMRFLFLSSAPAPPADLVEVEVEVDEEVVGEKSVDIKAESTKVITIGDLFEAIRMVETGNCPNNGIGALGDNGKSLGPFQISEAYFKDAEVTGTYFQVNEVNKAKSIMLRYWMRYCPTALMNHDWEVLARVHNGGPSGDTKKGTIKYWNKVLKHLMVLMVIIIMSGCSVAREQPLRYSNCPGCQGR